MAPVPMIPTFIYIEILHDESTVAVDFRGNGAGPDAKHQLRRTSRHPSTAAQSPLRRWIRRTGRSFRPTGESGGEDQKSFQKLEVLRSLIDNEIMLQRAEKSGLMATDADVETKLNELRAPYTKEQFEQQLKTRNMTLDDLKAQLRKELSVSQVVEQGNYFADQYYGRGRFGVLHGEPEELQSCGAAACT